MGPPTERPKGTSRSLRASAGGRCEIVVPAFCWKISVPSRTPVATSYWPRMRLPGSSVRMTTESPPCHGTTSSTVTRSPVSWSWSRTSPAFIAASAAGSHHQEPGARADARSPPPARACPRSRSRSGTARSPRSGRPARTWRPRCSRRPSAGWTGPSGSRTCRSRRSSRPDVVPTQSGTAVPRPGVVRWRTPHQLAVADHRVGLRRSLTGCRERRERAVLAAAGDEQQPGRAVPRPRLVAAGAVADHGHRVVRPVAQRIRPASAPGGRCSPPGHHPLQQRRVHPGAVEHRRPSTSRHPAAPACRCRPAGR